MGSSSANGNSDHWEWEIHGILFRFHQIKCKKKAFPLRGWQGYNATIWRRWLGREFLETSPVRGGRRPKMCTEALEPLSLPVDTSTEIEHP